MKKKIRVMHYTIEDPISDIRSLKRWLRELEQDEGIRIVGRIPGFAGGGFLFVGFRLGKYCVNVCDRIWDGKRRVHKASRGGRWLEFSSFDKLWRFIRPLVSRPIRAWVY